MTAAPIEPRSGAAYWTDDDRLVHYSACQGAHPARDALCSVYGLPDALRTMAVTRLFGIPILVYIFFSVMLAKTPFGRHLYMIGGNAIASIRSGGTGLFPSYRRGRLTRARQ